MSEIALYNLLKRIPDVSDDEAKEAVADVANARDVATKSDIAEIETTIAKLKEELTWRLVIAMGIYTAIISFITKVL